MAEMVRSAPNQILAERYQEGLNEFDEALATVREYAEASEPIPDAGNEIAVNDIPAKKGSPVFTTENIVASPVGPKVPFADESKADEDEPGDATDGISLRTVCWLFLFLGLIGFGGWFYLKVEEDRYLEKQARVAILERQGAVFIENRRWPEAAESFDEIENIFPDSELVELGRRSIEAGMIEEQNQFIGYWTGEAIAAFEAGRWDDAEKAATEVILKYPNEEEVADLLAKIAIARVEEERQAAFDLVRKQIEERKFGEAISKAEELVSTDRSDQDALALRSEARAAKEQADADLARARMLLDQALAKDTGEYNEEAIEWLREAVSLAPDDKSILASYEKMANYARTIRVPEDFKTVQEALASARDRDRLVIGEGTWEGPFVLTSGVKIEGVAGKTIVQCAADSGSVITIGPGVRGARVSGLTIRHLSFDAGDDRYSLALVRDAVADFADCHFEQGSGHGLAVTEGGHAKVLRCRFTENGWNGIAVIGAGSLLEAEGNTLKGNFQNGIESWGGASVIFSKNICTGNSRNGIHVDNGEASCTVLENELTENREFGMVLSSAGSGEVSGNTMRKNMLGGMVVRAGSTKVLVKENTITANEGPGLVLERGVDQTGFVNNRMSGNGGEELLSGVEFPE